MSSYVGNIRYNFIPAASGSVIDFSGQEGFNPRWLKSITNQTRNKIIYVPGLTGISGSFDALTNKVLTLEYNTATHNANDILLFMYDDQQDILHQINENIIALDAHETALLERLITAVDELKLALLSS
jgi:hypothetical protein